MVDYSWDFTWVLTYSGVLLRGAIGTVRLASIGLIIGISLGLLIGLARHSKRKLLQWPALVYIEIFRNIPMLVLIIWFFHALPVIIGREFSTLSAAVSALSLNTAAFSAEVFRGGIEAIPRTQWEAGRALGMGYFSLMKRIILPQGVRVMVPAFMNRAIELTKTTSLASAIAYAELLYQGKLISSILYRPIEIFTIIALIYFAILYIATLAVRRFEVRLRRSGIGYV